MVSYLGSLVQFSRAAGRAGRCRQTSLCVGSTPCVPATLGLPRSRVSVLSPSTLLRLPAALYGAGPALRAVPVPHKSADSVAPAFCVFPGLSGSGSQRPGALSTGVPRLFPPRPQRAPPVGSQGVLRQDPGPVCPVGGGGFSGAEFAPFPSPPASYLQRGWPALLWSFSVPLFCEPPAVCSSRLIFPHSPTV